MSVCAFGVNRPPTPVRPRPSRQWRKNQFSSVQFSAAQTIASVSKKIVQFSARRARPAWLEVADAPPHCALLLDGSIAPFIEFNPGADIKLESRIHDRPHKAANE